MLPTFILASGLCGDAVIKNFGDMLSLEDCEVLAWGSGAGSGVARGGNL